MVDRKVQVSFFVYLILFPCQFAMQIWTVYKRSLVSIGAWIWSCANTAVLALPEVENPYLAHHFYMPGIWTPLLVFIQRICLYL